MLERSSNDSRSFVNWQLYVWVHNLCFTRRREQKVDQRALRDRALTVGDKPSSLRLYRLVRGTVRKVLFPFLRLKSEGAEILDLDGPAILAPVHRSHLDSVLVASLGERRQRALGKESLFTTPGVGYVCAALGALPVRRGTADKEALLAAKMLLDRGESIFVFPEGGRQPEGPVKDLFDGAAWLSARTGARVVPVGIAGTSAAMPEHAKMLKRTPVAIVVGEPMPAVVGADGGRAKREDMARFTAELTVQLQAAQDRAIALLD
ncbi:MAG: lysophospholipid acyltransferase family protein [Acidimicrobiales bacterium]